MNAYLIGGPWNDETRPATGDESQLYIEASRLKAERAARYRRSDPVTTVMVKREQHVVYLYESTD